MWIDKQFTNKSLVSEIKKLEKKRKKKKEKKTKNQHLFYDFFFLPVSEKKKDKKRIGCFFHQKKIKKKNQCSFHAWTFHIACSAFFFFSSSSLKSYLINQKGLLWWLDTNPFHFYSSIHSYSNEKGNPLGNVQSFSFLLENMVKDEKKFMPRANYMKYQGDVSSKMRTVLIDWLIDVHLKFKLLPKTLFLSINILDRFLSSKKISRQKLQLLGVTTLLVASKYEEIYAPETRDFVYISDNVYSQEEIFKMEALICTVLKFEFSYPSMLGFLAHFLKILHPNREFIFFSNYCIELTLLEMSILKYSFSLVAVSTLRCVKKLLHHLPEKLNFFWTYPGFFSQEEEKENVQEEECFRLIKSIVFLGQNEKQKVGAIQRKYGTKKFGEVARSTFRIRF
jgi:cyclin B